MPRNEGEPKPKKVVFTIRGRENIYKVDQIKRRIWAEERKQSLPLTAFTYADNGTVLEISANNPRGQEWFEDGLAEYGISAMRSETMRPNDIRQQFMGPEPDDFDFENDEDAPPED